MALTGRALAWLNLATHFAQHVIWRLPRRAVRGNHDLARFLGTVAPEGYVPLSPQEREIFPAFMRCVHCGLCSLSCPALRTAPASAWLETWTFVAGPARSIDRAAVVLADLTPCADCGVCAAACPTGVPIPQLAAMVRRIGQLQQEEGSS
jgi:succinate dehydrogenase/fumarate reductase-like Fe-S protein